MNRRVVRDTNILQLPPSVDKLQHIVHLLAGSKSKRIGLALTEGITKMTALQTLSGIEISGSSTAGSDDVARGGCNQGTDKKEEEAQPGWCSTTASTNATDGYSGRCWRCKAASKGSTRGLHALENLTNLKKLTVYRLRTFTEMDNVLLVSAIEHLSSCSLKVLDIDDDFTGFLDSSLVASQAPPEHLHTLGLSGMLSKVPDWIVHLHNLESLTLSLTSLTASTLVVLSKLPDLFSLVFTMDSTMKKTNVLQILHKGGEIFVQAGGFEKLKLLRFATPVLPPLSFLGGAMPKLESLELTFVTMAGVYGLENLASLRQVLLTVSSHAPQVAKMKVSQIKALTRKNPNKPSVVVDEYNDL